MTHLENNPPLTKNAIDKLIEISSATLIVSIGLEKDATLLLNDQVNKFKISIDDRNLSVEEAKKIGFIDFNVIVIKEWFFIDDYREMWILITPNETYYSMGDGTNI